MSVETTLRRGLQLVGFTTQQINGVRRKKNLSRFRSHFTNNPLVYSILFRMLQETDREKANILPLFKKVGPKKVFDYYLMTIHLLACYPTEEEAEAIFHCSNVTWSSWVWTIVERVHYLLPEVVFSLTGGIIQMAMMAVKQYSLSQWMASIALLKSPRMRHTLRTRNSIHTSSDLLVWITSLQFQSSHSNVFGLQAHFLLGTMISPFSALG